MFEAGLSFGFSFIFSTFFYNSYNLAWRPSFRTCLFFQSCLFYLTRYSHLLNRFPGRRFRPASMPLSMFVRHIGLLLFFLYCLFPAYQAQPSGNWPDAHAYYAYDREPEVLNLVEVRKWIGYPPGLRAEGITGEVRLRLLVDRTGVVRDWIITHRLHPLIDAAVEAQIGHLRFLPAQMAGQPQAAWINLILDFSPRMGAPRPPQSRPWTWRAKARSQQRLAEGLQLYAQQDYQGAYLRLEEAQRLLASRAHPPVQDLITAHQQGGRAAAQIGQWEKAALSFSHALAWARIHEPGRVPGLLLDRAMARLSSGAIRAARSDCERALYHQPSRAAYCRRGLIFLQAGQIAEALTDF
ncbi:MAG: hypothetical protein D6722_18875, partial [Bacteroidetes bacterium]